MSPEARCGCLRSAVVFAHVDSKHFNIENKTSVSHACIIIWYFSKLFKSTPQGKTVNRCPTSKQGQHRNRGRPPYKQNQYPTFCDHWMNTLADSSARQTVSCGTLSISFPERCNRQCL